MFNFFKKKIIKKEEKSNQSTNDKMEISLWEMKEIYDFETEEIEKVVIQKRNFEMLRSQID